jgi:fibronectin type 3 domain-containing protein
MRRFVVVASMLASGIACVNLEKPAQVADCTTKGNCINRPSDSAVSSGKSDGPATVTDANVTPRADGADGVSTPDGANLNQDGPPPNAGDATDEVERVPDGPIGVIPADVGATSPDGGRLDDVAMVGKDAPEGSRDLMGPDVLPGACSAAGTPKPAGTVCRAAAGPCDLDEVCDGVTLECPTDRRAAAATPCRPTAGDCDISETCDGTNAACPLDGFLAAGTVCRGTAGVCDVAESCDGESAHCPEDSVAPATTVCRASADQNQCDPAESCTGTDVACPSDQKYTKPSAPTGVKATEGALQATISWTLVAGATGYNVKQSTTSGSGYTTLVSSPTTATSPYTNQGLTNGVTYYYVVSAINTIPTCESGSSSEVFAVPTGSCAPAPPAAPVIAATPGNGSVALTWTAVTGAVSYSVARSQTPGTGYATIGSVTTGTTFTDGNVTNGVTYYYVVTASNGSCSSVNSNEVSSSPACVPPAAPTGLTATPSNGSVTLKWTAAPNAVSYSIYRNTTGVEPFTIVNSTTQLTFTDNNVVNDTKYYYTVRASNGSCSSVNSTVVPVTPACVPPSAPTGVAVTPGDQQAVVTWTAPTGATQYRVSRNTTGTGAFTQVGLPTTTSFTDKPLANGTTYYYVVAAGNGACWSTDSAAVSGIPVCTPPPVPGTLTATPGDGQVSLSWGASQGATGYTIWRKIGAAGAYASIGTATSTTYLDKLLTNGTTYYYKVSASNGSCDSDFDAEQSATPAAACSQTPPTNVKATASGSVQVTLTWTAPTTTPTNYTIARSSTSGSGFTSIGSAAGTATSYTDIDTTLVKNTTYYYQVTANGSCTATSPEVSATTACSNPAAPATPTVSNSNGTITVTWATVDGATAYTVYRDTDANGSFTTAVATNQTAATFPDPASGLSNGITYYYEVSASNAGAQCVSAKSSAGSAMSCAPPSIPSALKASVGTSGQVRLTWTASTPTPTQYKILRSTSSNTEVQIGTSNTNSYTDTGLTDWTPYFYKVSAQNGTENRCSSDVSAEISATPNGCPVLPAGSGGYPVSDTTRIAGPYCFYSCDDRLADPLQGVGFSNRNGRSLTINGTAMTCPSGGGGNCTMQPAPTRDYTTYPTSGAYLYRVTAESGSVDYSRVYWWPPSKACQ